MKGESKRERKRKEKRKNKQQAVLRQFLIKENQNILSRNQPTKKLTSAAGRKLRSTRYQSGKGGGEGREGYLLCEEGGKGRTGEDRGGQGRTGEDRGGQGRTGEDRGGQGRKPFIFCLRLLRGGEVMRAPPLMFLFSAATSEYSEALNICGRAKEGGRRRRRKG